MFRAGLYALVSTTDKQTLAMRNCVLREYAAPFSGEDRCAGHFGCCSGPTFFPGPPVQQISRPTGISERTP